MEDGVCTLGGRYCHEEFTSFSFLHFFLFCDFFSALLALLLRTLIAYLQRVCMSLAARGASGQVRGLERCDDELQTQL